MDLRAEAIDAVRHYVWAGYDDEDEVFGLVDEDVLFESDGEHEAWLRTAIKREFRKKQAAERTWPEVTDCNRLDRAFEVLNKEGILAQHKAGYTQQDGLEVVERLYAEASGEQSDIGGYCFYTIQDMEGAMWGEVGLWLAFGRFSGDSEKGVAVGRQVRDILTRFGFAVVWDGSIESRLLLSGFRWQRRSPHT